MGHGNRYQQLGGQRPRATGRGAGRVDARRLDGAQTPATRVQGQACGPSTLRSLTLRYRIRDSSIRLFRATGTAHGRTLAGPGRRRATSKRAAATV